MAIIDYENEIVVNTDEIHKGIAEFDEETFEIIDEIRLSVIHKDMTFKVYAYHVEDDADMYSIIVYDSMGNEISQSYLDSTGGGVCGEEIQVYDKNNRFYEVENAIADTLFGNKKLGIKAQIIPF